MGKKLKSGGARMMAKGYKPVLLQLTPDQHELIRQAAVADNRPMAQFAKLAALEAAKRFLEAATA